MVIIRCILVCNVQLGHSSLRWRFRCVDLVMGASGGVKGNGAWITKLEFYRATKSWVAKHCLSRSKHYLTRSMNNIHSVQYNIDDYNTIWWRFQVTYTLSFGRRDGGRFVRQMQNVSTIIGAHHIYRVHLVGIWWDCDWALPRRNGFMIYVIFAIEA